GNRTHHHPRACLIGYRKTTAVQQNLDRTRLGQRKNTAQDSRAKQAEVEVERRPDFLHLSLNLPITLADFFSILLIAAV
ncbi:MAG TPA: hypothetical protein VIW48_00830, partial [Nitrospiraceae bacterium]